MPARKAPSASDRPASAVRHAEARITISTLSTNSSVDLRRATRPNQARITRGPASSNAASTNAALPSARATAGQSSAAGWPSTGTTISSGTTARSWNSSTPTIERPCAVSSSMRSASSFMTTAVDDIASAPPTARPVCQPPASSSASAMLAAMVIATCARPSPNTSRRITRSLGRLNSSPIENIRNTTPNSASRCVSTSSGTAPKALGPSVSPTTR